MAGGQERYYLELAREDYYSSGGEPLGLWRGRLATVLDLPATVQKDQLRPLLAGLSPEGRQLVQRQNWQTRSRIPGWDLTFSAPKSVSVLWALSDAQTRKSIQQAHLIAVERAFSYVEQNAAFTRRGAGGKQLEPCLLAAAFFEHGTSRAQDPQLHTHVLIPNVGLRHDGSTGALESKPMFEHKMATGALYRAELAFQLEQKLGVQTTPVRGWFEVSGVPTKLTDHFSTRRKEIAQENALRGMSTAKASERAALQTRSRKDHVARELLLHKWRDEAQRLGFGQRHVPTLLQNSRDRSHSAIERTANVVLQDALEKATSTRSVFQEKDLVRFAAEQAQGQGLNADQIVRQAKQVLNGDRLRSIPLASGKTFYATVEQLQLEQETLALARLSRADSRHILSDKSVNQAIAAVEAGLKKKHQDTSLTLSAEQKRAVAHVTQRQGSLQCVQGHAGAGKTTLLAAARLAWEKEGYTVLGTSLSARAAKGLEAESGINSQTLALLKIRLAHRAEDGPKPLQLTPQTVIVVDEAGMVGPRDIAFLLRETQRATAKLVLVGDTDQLQPIEPGAPFRQVMQEIGAVELAENRRQRSAWEKEALSLIREGHGRAALTEYASYGRVHVSASDVEARRQLVATWFETHPKERSQALILAATNQEVDHLNRLVQAERQTRREIPNVHGVRCGSDRFVVGDRLLFTKNNRVLDVCNGDFGTVQCIGPFSLTVRLDARENRSGVRSRSKCVTFMRSEYEHVKLGYALTTHKAQGATCERAYILGNPTMQDRELSYVQLSRAKERTDIFLAQQQAGEDLVEFASALERSRKPRLIHDFIGLQELDHQSPTLEQSL